MGSTLSHAQCCCCWSQLAGTSGQSRQEISCASAVRPVAGNSVEAVWTALRHLDSIYEGNALNEGYGSQRLSAHEAHKNHGLTYGELLPIGVAVMLNLADAKYGDCYFDLGSGTGKTAVLAWLLGLDAWGVELVRERWETSRQIQKRVVKDSAGDPDKLHFVHKDLLDVDFSSADIVFANSLMFPQGVLSYIASTARRMKPGSRIITDAEGQSAALPGPGFRLQHKLKLPTTWSSGIWFAIHTVV